MKNKIFALMMCGMLAMTLFACGEKRGAANDSDILGDERHYTNGSTNSGMTGGSSSNGSDATRNARQRITTGNNADNSNVMGDSAVRGSTLNPANGTQNRTDTWEQRLQNGRIHDTDGFLFDSENSHWN